MKEFSRLQRRIKEVVLVLVVFITAFLITALVSYHPGDPGWSHSADMVKVSNSAGPVGAWLSDFLFYILGDTAYFIPILALVGSWLSYRHVPTEDEPKYGLWLSRSIGCILLFATTAGLLALFIPATWSILPMASGGILGYIVGVGLAGVLGKAGTSIILLGVWLVSMTLLTGLAWTEIFQKTMAMLGRALRQFGTKLREIKWGVVFARLKPKPKVRAVETTSTAKKENVVPVIKRPVRPDDNNMVQLPPTKGPEKLADKVKKVRSKPKVVKPIVQESSLPKDIKPTADGLPPLDLLNEAQVNTQAQFSNEELTMRSEQVEQRLADYGVEVKVVAVHPGPVVTRFELELAAGTKVSKITTLAKDLARSLSVVSVRVVEVIPGKAVIGLELPNPEREMVGLKDTLGSTQYQHARSSLSLGLGKDIGGHPVVVDLAKMPHLLVAGTTGSGKSVGVNCMLISLLYKATPKDLRLILIDPKMLELSVYDDIPHLLAPVVTDMNEAATALRWCVVEMERRYRLMAALGVRNIAGYNAKVREAKAKGAPLLDPLIPEASQAEPEELQELPKIVVVADEFADMMVVVGKKVETLITRLAQKARAAGIHLILATQRPSVDVITGLIKANIPSRISFQVSSKVDSRTILDQGGAEQLLGNGDMLYLPPGSGVPMRVHGAFVSDDEVHRVVDFLKLTGQPDYLEAVLDASAGDAGSYVDAAMGGGSSGEEKSSEDDEYYDQAVEFVTKSRRVSISSVQRRFKIGYNRAANIVEAMEAAGVVSEMGANGQRDVLAPPPAGE